MFDRIEAGTFIIAGAAISKKIKITGIETKILKKELQLLKKILVLKSSTNIVHVRLCF